SVRAEGGHARRWRDDHGLAREHRRGRLAGRPDRDPAGERRLHTVDGRDGRGRPPQRRRRPPGGRGGGAPGRRPQAAAAAEGPALALGPDAPAGGQRPAAVHHGLGALVARRPVGRPRHGDAGAAEAGLIRPRRTRYVPRRALPAPVFLARRTSWRTRAGPTLVAPRRSSSANTSWRWPSAVMATTSFGFDRSSIHRNASPSSGKSGTSAGSLPPSTAPARSRSISSPASRPRR